MLQGQDPSGNHAAAAFQVLRKQAGSESWELVLFSVLICARVHSEAILTIELKGTLFLSKFYLNAALLPWNWTMKMG